MFGTGEVIAQQVIEKKRCIFVALSPGGMLTLSNGYFSSFSERRITFFGDGRK